MMSKRHHGQDLHLSSYLSSGTRPPPKPCCSQIRPYKIVTVGAGGGGGGRFFGAGCASWLGLTGWGSFPDPRAELITRTPPGMRGAAGPGEKKQRNIVCLCDLIFGCGTSTLYVSMYDRCPFKPTGGNKSLHCVATMCICC